MRNRPDSRHRLAGLQPVSAPRSARPADIDADRVDADDDTEPQQRGEADGRPRTSYPAGRGRNPDEAAPAPDRDDALIGGWTPDQPDEERDITGRGREPVGTGDPTTGPRRRAPRLSSGRLTQRWVPESLREARIDPGKRGALLLTVVAAVAALVAAVGVWWDRPEPRPVQSVSLAQVTDSAAAGLRPATASTQRGRASGSLAVVSVTAAARTDSGSSAAPAVIIVSVTGAVRRPGLVRLPAGSRVADAIEKAGGASPQANLTGLNLAQKLSDGASVVVAGAGEQVNGSSSSVSDAEMGGGGSSLLPGAGAGAGAGAGGGGAGGGAAGKVDLNTADVAALDALPGVGPVTAASIVSWRQKNGRFTSVEQLQEIPGIGPAKYASLSPLVTV